MPERRRIPEEPLPPKPSKPTGDDQQPTQPYLPPEVPDEDATRVQTAQDQTRYMPPVKDTRLNPPQSNTPPEKPKRDSGAMIPSPPSQSTPYRGDPNSKPKRGQQPVYAVAARDNRMARRNSPLRLPIWSVLLMLMLVVGAVACVVVAILGLGGRSAPTAPPEFVVISAVPSDMPAVTIPSLLATPTLPAQFQGTEGQNFVLAGPTLEPIIYTETPTPAPQITIGSIVVIIGNQGINIRNNYGMDSGVVIVANPGEQYKVLDGPRQSNGLNWWQISDPMRGIVGWAADNDGTTDLFQVVTP